MVSNPMQRKARNSFLAGMLVMLIIAGIIIGLLVMLLMKEKQADEQEQLSDVYVLNTSVKSGQIITPDMLRLETVPSSTVPNNAVEDLTTIINYSLQEKATGNTIKTDNNGVLYIEDNGKAVRITQDGENYYKTVNNNPRQLVEFTDVPLMAKVNMQANSVVTLELISKSNEIASDDLRLQEYNMLLLPAKLDVDDYIDVRLTLPSGQDFIVISKKRIVDMMEDTVWLQLTEEEILTMSNAIVEAYQMTGSKLYATLYTEPGLQEDATPTYAVSPAVWELIDKNPNIRAEARSALASRYNQGLNDLRVNYINNSLQQYAEQAQSNIEQRLKEENEKRKELREKYLETLSGTTTGIVE